MNIVHKVQTKCKAKMMKNKKKMKKAESATNQRAVKLHRAFLLQPAHPLNYHANFHRTSS